MVNATIEHKELKELTTFLQNLLANTTRFRILKVVNKQFKKFKLPLVALDDVPDLSDPSIEMFARNLITSMYTQHYVNPQKFIKLINVKTLEYMKSQLELQIYVGILNANGLQKHHR